MERDKNNAESGPAVRVAIICKKCRSECKRSFAGYHGCDTCNAWVTDVEHKRIRAFSMDV